MRLCFIIIVFIIVNANLCIWAHGGVFVCVCATTFKLWAHCITVVLHKYLCNNDWQQKSLHVHCCWQFHTHTYMHKSHRDIMAITCCDRRSLLIAHYARCPLSHRQYVPAAAHPARLIGTTNKTLVSLSHLCSCVSVVCRVC